VPAVTSRYYALVLDTVNLSITTYADTGVQGAALSVSTNTLTNTFSTTANGVITNNPPLVFPDLVDNFSYLGRSQSQADGMLAGAIDEFRVYYGALNATDIANSFSLGPNQAKLFAVDNAGTLSVSWTNSVLTAPFILQTNANVLNPAGWVTWNAGNSNIASGFHVVTLPASGGPLYFRLREP